MAERSIRNCRILVVEDEYMLADELRTELGRAEAIVLGPAATVEDALALIASGQSIDGAILDVNLRGKMAFTVADLLLRQHVPFVFTTGYDESAIPTRFAGIVRCEKPLPTAKIVKALADVIGV
jgi:DNA-binding response OmpR family regulator